MNALEQQLRQEIGRQGIISFARFMALALYHPADGYYEREIPVMGRAGDFYTSAAVGPLFGELLAFQFAEWLDTLPGGTVQLVEAGAHHARLAADILGWLGKNRPDLFRRLQYWIVEPSARRQIWQKRTLIDFADRTRWFANWITVGEKAVSGIIFSNELMDAMPVHRLGWDAAGQRWFEWGVALQGHEFIWQRIPLTLPAHLEAALKGAGLTLPPELATVLPDGFAIELSPAAGVWWTAAAHSLRRGKLITMDYGRTAEEVWSPGRPHGTLRAYRRHQISPDPLATPGQQDLTAHVNFTQLRLAGETAGLYTEGLTFQAQFLTGIAERLWRATTPASGPAWTSGQVRQFHTLTHPDHLGRAFRVLVQARQLPG